WLMPLLLCQSHHSKQAGPVVAGAISGVPQGHFLCCPTQRLGLFFRPAALSFAHSALPDEKIAQQG
ncbi:MAG: hypothetical protein K1563_20905, partial [Candidatus Thiodiazotropha sp. (ex. Lucinisca nassula)]|nr:hypothetical protein [Candidatus Thiodiazotropha sp. (ex. Lucinisca nassula)]